MSHEHVVHAMIPDRFGLTVVDVEQLLGYLAEGQDLEEAITNAGMDSVDHDHIADHVERLRRLNATGDGRAYWDLGEDAGD